MKRLLVIGTGAGFPERKLADKENGIDTYGIDIIPEFNPTRVMDIETEPLGFKDAFDEVEIFHCLEHIESNRAFKRIMWDIYEALKKGGIVKIAVPYWKDESAVESYEHCRFFNENSFMNFYDNRYAKEMHLPVFEKVSNEIAKHGNGSIEVRVTLRKPL